MAQLDGKLVGTKHWDTYQLMKFVFNHQNFQKLQKYNDDLQRKVNQLELQLEKAKNDKPSKKAAKSSTGTSTPKRAESSGEGGTPEVTGGEGNPKEV